VYLGEFGAIRYTFEAERGGITWLSDLLDILISGKINFNYHTWHESNFGLFANDSGFPDPAYERTVVTDLFRLKQLQGPQRGSQDLFISLRHFLHRHSMMPFIL
jgi:endoglucanase